MKEKYKTRNRKRINIPWRFIVTALLIVLQTALSLWVTYIAERRYAVVQLIFSIVWVVFVIIIINKEESASYKLPWVIIILAFPIAGSVLFMIFGKPRLSPKAQIRFNTVNPDRSQVLKQSEKTQEKLKEKTIGGASISNYLLNTSKTPVYENTRSEFLSTGEIFFEKLFEDVENAKEYVFLEYFIVGEGKIWEKLYEILLKKVAQGVSVYMIYDDFGCMNKLPVGFDYKLRKQGVNCFRFNPVYPIVSIVHNNRDHRKIAVIDGRIAYTGGINLADEYANVEKPYGLWKDGGIRIEGDAVDSFCVMFIENYNSACEKPLKAEDFLRPHEQEPSSGFVQPFADGPRPVDEDYIGQMLYLNVIYSAKRYLYITTPYFIVDSCFFDALDSCVKRGVDVRIITPHIPDKKTVFAVTRSAYARLIKSGVKVYEYEPGFIHSKTIVSDDVIGVAGTINFDYRSFVHHYECGAVLYGCDCLADMKSDFLNLVENECIMQTEQSAKLSLVEKLVKTVCEPLTPLL